MYKLNNFNGWVKEALFPSYLVKPFWTALAGMAISAYQGDKASDAADASAAAAGASRAERLEIAQKSYDDYKTTFGPNEQALVDSVDNFTMRDNLQKYQAEGTVNVAKAFDKSKEMQQREMGRYGINPASQRFQQKGNLMGNERAKQEVLVRNQARDKAESERIEDEDKLFSRQLAVGKFGRTSAPAEDQLMDAYGSDASAYDQQEAGYAEQAGAGYGLAGELLGSAISDYGANTSTSDYNIPDADTGELGW